MNDLMECPHCGSVAEYVSQHAKGKRWAVACTMTSKVAADEGRPMCRCRTPFFRDKGQARDVWNRRAAYRKCSECKERQGYYLDAETIQRQQERIAELERMLEHDRLEIICYENDVDARDELIRDMWPLVLADGASEAFVERMRELGIEVES